MPKTLCILLLLLASYAHAKDGKALPLTDDNTIIPATSESRAGLTVRKFTTTPYLPYSGDHGDHKVHFYWDMEGGYLSGTTITKDATTTSGGFMYKVALGVKIELPVRGNNTAALLGIGASGGMYPVNKHDFGLIGLPISYTRMHYGRSEKSLAFYWQAGLNIYYANTVRDGDKLVGDHYAKIFAEPCISAGVNTEFHVQKWGGEKTYVGRAFIGPFCSYMPTNLSKYTGTTLHGYTIGLRYALVFM